MRPNNGLPTAWDEKSDTSVYEGPQRIKANRPIPIAEVFEVPTAIPRQDWNAGEGVAGAEAARPREVQPQARRRALSDGANKTLAVG